MARLNRWEPQCGWSHDAWILQTPDGDICTVRRIGDEYAEVWEARVIPRQGLPQVQTCSSRYAAQRACRRMLRELGGGA